MAQFNDVLFDAAANVIKNSTETLYILSGDPGLTWENIATMGIGSKSGPTISAPVALAGGGSKATVAAIADGLVTAAGTNNAQYYALTDDSASLILVSGSLGAAKDVVNGNPFTTTEFDINFPSV